jgi:hypothetical protein
MRTLLIAAALAMLVASQTACGSSNAASNSESVQRYADLYAIGLLEKNFHKATSRQDIDLMMSLWARNATFTLGSGKTLTGEGQIRRFWRLEAPQFEPENRWLSDTPAYKLRITVNGERGTLYFECHYIDVKTRKVVAIAAGDLEVARINGRWLITDLVAASPTLSR